MTQGSFEAKLHGFRRTQDGVVVSYVVHPDDVSKELATAALGTRFMIGFAAIGDDEGPVAQSSVTGKLTPEAECVVERVPDAGASPAGAVQSKDRKPFASLPLSQQAGIRSQDKLFWEFLVSHQGPVTGFDFIDNEKDAASYVRIYCGVSSRAALDCAENSASHDHWFKLESLYQSWLVTRKYGASQR